MTDIVLNPISSGYNVQRINANFEILEEVINEEVLHTVGGNNVMRQDLDMNNHSLLNLSTNPNDPDSLITIEQGDLRYYNVLGDTLNGPMDVNGQAVFGLRTPVNPSEPVRKDNLDAEIEARTAADSYLQAQISGTEPLAASAFSAISWHDQTIITSVTIPENKNAWSFGPTMTIADGQEVTISDGSFWTIANGEV